MYDKIFGSGGGIGATDVGGGAAIGVTVALLVLVSYFVMNRLLKEEVYEY